MPGGRGKIGLVVPANNSAVEYDFWKMAPEGVSIHSTRMPSVKGDEPYGDIEVEKFKESLSQALNLLDKVSDIIIYGRTYGTRSQASLIKSLNSKVVIPGEEVVKKIKSLEAKKIFLLTPYNKKRTLDSANYLSSNGFDVIGYDFMNKISGVDISNTPTFSIYRFVKRNLDKAANADLIYIDSTALSTSNVVTYLKKDINIPVLCENVILMESALDHLSIKRLSAKSGSFPNKLA